MTGENAEAVMAQLTAIDEARLPLTDEEMAQVDFTRYSAAIASLNALSGQPGAEEPAPVAEKPEITGVTVTVDGKTYSSGYVTITPATQSVIVTITGSNFGNSDSSVYHDYALDCFPGTDLELHPYMSNPTSDDTVVIDLSARMEELKYCNYHEIAYTIEYSNVGQQIWNGTGIYLIYSEDDTAKPVIEGLSITVDGKEYTEGNVTIYSNREVSITVSGDNFADLSSISSTYLLSILAIVPDDISTWTVDAAANTATKSFPASYFKHCDNDSVRYLNSTVPIETGIYLTYSNLAPAQPARITKVVVTVNDDPVASGVLWIDPDTQVSITVIGSNFKNLNESNLVRYSPSIAPSTVKDWTAGSEENEYTLPLSGDSFRDRVNYEVCYSNDGGATWNNSGIKITCTNPARITGVSVKVGENTYTQGTVTIMPDSEVTILVSGENFEKIGSVDGKGLSVSYIIGSSDTISVEDWTIEGNTAAKTVDAAAFAQCINFEITYENGNQSAEKKSGIFLTYDDGISEEEKARITGMTLTVDGVTYTEGTAIITPGTKSILCTLTGERFENLTTDHYLKYEPGVAIWLKHSDVSADTEKGTATLDIKNRVTDLSVYLNHKLQYTNDGQPNWIDSGIFLNYVSCDHGSGTKSYEKIDEAGHISVYNCCGAKVSEDHVYVAENPGQCDLCGHVCDHSGNTNSYTNNGDTHSFTCSVCLAEVTAVAHDYTYDAENHKCICGDVEKFTITWDMSGCTYEGSNFSELPTTLAYNVDGWEHDVTFMYITAPAGYRFAGFVDGNGEALNTTSTDRRTLYLTVSGDMTIKAVIEPRTYVATWTDGNGASYEKEFEYGETITIPDNENFNDTFREAGYTLTG